MNFTTGTRDDFHPGALAYAQPFASGIPVITVLYDRLQSTVAARPRLEQTVLAHVLAHEIGHILSDSERHAETGMMKAHWSPGDVDQMATRPLSFTAVDKELITWRWKVVNHADEPR